MVQRVSESYPVRRAAQLLVSLYFRGQNAIRDSKVSDINPGKLRSFAERFKNNLKEEMENAKKELKRK